MPQTPPSGTELEKLYSDIRRELDSIRNFTELISVRSPALLALAYTCSRLHSRGAHSLPEAIGELRDALSLVEHSLMDMQSVVGCIPLSTGKSLTT